MQGWHFQDESYGQDSITSSFLRPQPTAAWLILSRIYLLRDSVSAPTLFQTGLDLRGILVWKFSSPLHVPFSLWLHSQSEKIIILSHLTVQRGISFFLFWCCCTCLSCQKGYWWGGCPQYPEGSQYRTHVWWANEKKKYTSNQITLFFHSLNSLLDCCSSGEANLKTFARGGKHRCNLAFQRRHSELALK